jgi:D-alanyl-D-alanine carboxypeptidase (penicillin-binding protein 5/6)
MKNAIHTRGTRWSVHILIALLLASFLLLAQNRPVLAATTSSTPPDISALHAQLVDLTTHQQLMTKDPTTETEIASTTKIMTALLVIESGKLNQSVTVLQKYIDYIIDNDASNAGLLVGDTLTVNQLLYALLLPSGCDAAFALAETVGGSFDGFIAKMNQRAQQLGLTQTYYTTPDGLHNPDSAGTFGYSTAADLSKLTAYALQYPLFRQVVGTLNYSVAATTTNHAYTWTNTNRLLTTYAGAIGVKTGTTPWAGYVLVFAATRQGHTLLGVIIDSTSNDQRYADATALLDWGFSTVTGTARTTWAAAA